MTPGTVCSTTQGSRALGNVLQLLVGDVGRDRLAIRLDDRRVAGDLHLFGHALHAERDAQRDDAAGADRHGAVQVIGESLERGLDLVGAGGQVEQVHLPLRVGDRGLVLRPGDVDRHARAARPRCCRCTVTSMRPVKTCAFAGRGDAQIAASAHTTRASQVRCEFLI